MHRAARGFSRTPRGWRMEHAPDADPPRRVAGGASLGRARPLASLVALGGTTASGSMPNGSFLRRRHRLAPMCGQSTSENRAPTSRRGLGVAKHGRDAFHRVVTNRAMRHSRNEGSGCDPTGSVSRTRSRRPLPFRGSLRSDSLAHLSASTRHVTFAWELSSLDPPVARSRLATLCGSTNQRCVRPMSAQSLEWIRAP